MWGRARATRAEAARAPGPGARCPWWDLDECQGPSRPTPSRDSGSCELWTAWPVMSRAPLRPLVLVWVPAKLARGNYCGSVVAARAVLADGRHPFTSGIKCSCSCINTFAFYTLLLLFKFCLISCFLWSCMSLLTHGFTSGMKFTMSSNFWGFYVL